MGQTERYYTNGLRRKLGSLNGVSKGVGCLVAAGFVIMTVLAGFGYSPSSVLRGDIIGNSTVQAANLAAKGGVKGDMAQFASIFCNLVSSAQDDPILYPGQPGAAHLHDFFGNATTNAYTTTQSLVDEMNAFKADPTHKTHRSSCYPDEPLDFSAYWVPAMGVPDGQGGTTWTHASTINAYYTYGGTDNTPYPEQYPLGLRMIAGDSHNTNPLNLDSLYFQCTKDGGGKTVYGPKLTEIHACADGYKLHAHVIFPDCWDGTWLYQPGTTHMVYSGGSVKGGPDCPADHPVKLPQLDIGVNWGTQGSEDGYLASDLMTEPGAQNHGRSLHGDFWNAWDEGHLKILVAWCLNGQGPQGQGACRPKKEHSITKPGPYDTLPPPYPTGQEYGQGLVTLPR